MYIAISLRVKAFRDQSIKKSAMGSNPDKTEMPELLDEGSKQLVIGQPEAPHSHIERTEKPGPYTVIKTTRNDVNLVRLV